MQTQLHHRACRGLYESALLDCYYLCRKVSVCCAGWVAKLRIAGCVLHCAAAAAVWLAELEPQLASSLAAGMPGQSRAGNTTWHPPILSQAKAQVVSNSYAGAFSQFQYDAIAKTRDAGVCLMVPVALLLLKVMPAARDEHARLSFYLLACLLFCGGV